MISKGKSFLHEVAERFITEHPNEFHEHIFVFPNRRAALFFLKIFSEIIQRPVLSPAVYAINDFFAALSPSAQVTDNLELIAQLYPIYNEAEKKNKSNRTFDSFYFLGNLMLRNFDEIDKHLLKAETVYKNLSNWKKIDALFEDMPQEQKEYLENFWQIAASEKNRMAQRFLDFWDKVGGIYARFKETLQEREMAYEGMMQREVVDRMEQAPDTIPHGDKKIHFVGFNALLPTEEKLISFFRRQKRPAEIYWDVDAYYMEDHHQEAGDFLRQYAGSALFKETFNPPYRKHLAQPKEVKSYLATHSIEQVKILAHVVEKTLRAGAQQEEILIVMPDENLLLPVLHAISGLADKINVTMGLPFQKTAMATWINLLLELQSEKSENKGYRHRNVKELLAHPYMQQNAFQDFQKKILSYKKKYISADSLDFFMLDSNMRIFFPKESVTSPSLEIVEYLIRCVNQIRKTGFREMDQEFAEFALNLLSRLKKLLGENKEMLGESDGAQALDVFQSLLHTVLRSSRLPLEGEPLEGIQIMGRMETRCLDFPHVFILSLNEGVFPAGMKQIDFVPYSLRKAYGLPATEWNDARESYLFYRLLQRAKCVHLFYSDAKENSRPDEPSRFLLQLQNESPWGVKEKSFHLPLTAKKIPSISIEKTPEMIEEIRKRFSKKLSPSALNTYLACRLQFYFRYVAKIRLPNDPEEDQTFQRMGLLLHSVLEAFYKNYKEQILTVEIIEQEQQKLPELLEKAAQEIYDMPTSEFSGQTILTVEAAKNIIDKIIHMDKSRMPFRLKDVECDVTHRIQITVAEEKINVNIGGIVDRIDESADGAICILDYKTGKDGNTIESIASLTDRENPKRNKAAYQLLLYAYLYQQNSPSLKKPIRPMLVTRKALYDKKETDFTLSMARESIGDATQYLSKIEAQTIALVTEIFDSKMPFDQTEDTDACGQCDYQAICRR